MGLWGPGRRRQEHRNEPDRLQCYVSRQSAITQSRETKGMTSSILCQYHRHCSPRMYNKYNRPNYHNITRSLRMVAPENSACTGADPLYKVSYHSRAASWPRNSPTHHAGSVNIKPRWGYQDLHTIIEERNLSGLSARLALR